MIKMDNFDEFIRKKSQYKEARTEKYKYDSKDRLSKILKKKVETTMIGAISSSYPAIRAARTNPAEVLRYV